MLLLDSAGEAAGSSNAALTEVAAASARARRPALELTRLVLLLFLVAQACDGVFTYFAVQALGIAVEGNQLLAAAMARFGPLPTLVGAKSLAAAAGLLLYLRGWHGTLAVVTSIYAFAALGPWLLVYVSWGA